MKSGKLRYPAHVVREITSTTSSGADTVDYESVLATRVGITTVLSKDYIEGGAETMETTVKVVMRRPNQRVLMGDIVYADNKELKVMGVLEFDNGKSLQLMCKELL